MRFIEGSKFGGGTFGAPFNTGVLSEKKAMSIMATSVMAADNVTKKPSPLIKTTSVQSSLSDEFIKTITNGQAGTLPEPETKKENDPMLTLYTTAVKFVMSNLKVVAAAAAGLALVVVYLLKRK